jgi:3-dehydroquinate dehydratase-1
MSAVVTVRGLEIGRGLPKIIVPIVEESTEKIATKAATFRRMPVDLVEWRADFYDHALDTERVLYTLTRLRETVGNMPILFTFRTAREGGKKVIGLEAYTALNTAVAESGNADLIDVELLAGDDVVRQNIANIHAAGGLVVGSNHDFSATPDKETLIARMRKMQDMGADIAKIAVMPKSSVDVLSLLTATAEMSEKYADRPLITISMSQRGVISRLTGELFGSAATFGSVDKISAPGQIPVEQLAALMNSLHSLL